MPAPVRGRRPARPGEDGPVERVEIRGDVIRLGQFLKLAGVIDSGADARHLLEEYDVRVNGEAETRRGRQLVRGDVVELGRTRLRVS